MTAIKNKEQYSKEKLEEILKNYPKNSDEYKSAYQKIWYHEHKSLKKEQAAKRYIENKEEYLNRNKKWRKSNKEHIAEHAKEYREKNLEEITIKAKIKYDKLKNDPEFLRKRKESNERYKDRHNKTGAEYRKNNKEKIKEKDLRWYNERGGKKKTKINYIKNKEHYNKIKKEKRTILINTFYHILGNKCAFCKKTDPVVFTIDHIKNDGQEERKKIHGTEALARCLKKRGWPENYIKERYQILCYNCNYSKNRREYLNKPISELTKKELKELNLLKSGYKFFGKCEMCKEDNLKYLTIDHRNCNGNLKRKIDKEPGGIQLLRRFELAGWPESLRLEYRFLCYNCNCGRQRIRSILAMPPQRQP